MPSKWAEAKAQAFFKEYQLLTTSSRRLASAATAPASEPENMKEEMAAALGSDVISGFKFRIGDVLKWKLVPESRVVVVERTACEVASGSVARKYTGNVAVWAADRWVPTMAPLEFSEVELAHFGEADSKSGT